jgi:hypothetical protein
MVPDLMSFSSSVDLGGHLIDIGVGVHVLPERLSVLWIVSSRVVLFRTIVIEWDASSGQSEGKSRFETGVIVELVLESSVIVVIDEDTKGINIFEFTIFLGKSVFDAIHTFS